MPRSRSLIIYCETQFNGICTELVVNAQIVIELVKYLEMC